MPHQAMHVRGQERPSNVHARLWTGGGNLRGGTLQIGDKDTGHGLETASLHYCAPRRAGVAHQFRALAHRALRSRSSTTGGSRRKVQGAHGGLEWSEPGLEVPPLIEALLENGSAHLFRTRGAHAALG